MDEPVLFFDGVCNLCNGAVTFVIDRDRAGRFRFSSLQSAYAASVLPALGVDPTALSTLVLVVDGRAYTKSTAVLRAAALLGGPWRLLGALRVIPRAVRDLAYDVVARSRYRVFGKTDQCRVPTPELRGRFLEAPA